MTYPFGGGGGHAAPSGGGGHRGRGPKLGEGVALLWLLSRLNDKLGSADEFIIDVDLHY